MGKEAIRLLKFAMKYPGWHSYANDPKIVRAVNRLRQLGFIEIVDWRFATYVGPNPPIHNQFRLIPQV